MAQSSIGPFLKGTAVRDLGSQQNTPAGVTGTGAGSVSLPTSAAAGLVTVTGTSAGSVSLVTSSAAGLVGATGAGTPSVSLVTSSATGAVTVTGTSAGATSLVTSSAAGLVGATGTSAASVSLVTATGVGTSGDITGTGAGSVSLVTSTAAGTITVTATSAGSVSLVTSAATGVITLTGTSAASVSLVTSTAAGLVGATGTSAASVALVTMAAAGTVGTQTNFYEECSNSVRSRWMTQVETPLSISTHYDNLPGFTRPATLWARVSVEFEDAQIESVGGAGGDGVLIELDGILRATLFQPMIQGTKAVMDQADAIMALFREMRDTTSVGDDVVRFFTPSIVRRNQGAAWYEVEIECPFRAEETSAELAVLTPALGLDGQDIGEALRGLWISAVADTIPLSTQYDGTPFTRPSNSAWARVTILDGEPVYMEDGFTRSVGVFMAQVFTPAEVGEKEGLQAVDTIDRAFRHRDLQGLRTGAPRVGAGQRSGPWWQHTVSVPWRADQAI